jgi:hypothetical protein
VTSETSFQTYAEQRAAFAQSSAVLTAAQERLATAGYSISFSDLHAQVATVASTSGALVTVTATAATADEAVATVNAVVDAYVALTKQDLTNQADTQLKSLTALIQDIETKARTIKSATVDSAAAQTLAQLQIRQANVTLDSANTDIARFVDPAQAAPISWVSLAVRGAVIGAALAILLALLAAFALVDVIPTQNDFKNRQGGPLDDDRRVPAT